MSTNPAIRVDADHGSWTLRLVTLAYIVGLAVMLSLWGAFLSRQTSLLAYSYRYDFLCGYVGARAVVTGNSGKLYDLSEQHLLSDAAIAPYQRPRLLPFVYPAYVALLLAPLGWLSYSHAFLLWDSINLALALILSVRLSRLGSHKREKMAFFFGAWTAMPLLLTLLHAQFGLLPALGLGEALLALRAGKSARAGAWLLLGLIKPQLILAPVFALLCWRCWRALGAFIAGTCLLAAASFVALGFWISAYLRLLADFERLGPQLSLYPGAMQNWRGAAWVAFGPHGTVFTLLLTGISILLILLLVWRRSHWELRLPAVVLLGLLISPHLYLHDLVFAIPAGIFLYLGLRSNRTIAALFMRGALALAPVVFFLAQTGTFGPVQIAPWYLIAVVLLTIAVVRGKAEFREMDSPAAPATLGACST
jgi:hypothetical protein